MALQHLFADFVFRSAYEKRLAAVIYESAASVIYESAASVNDEIKP